MVVSVQPDYLTFLTKKGEIFANLKSWFCIFFRACVAEAVKMKELTDGAL